MSSSAPERPAFLILWILAVTAASGAVVETLPGPGEEALEPASGRPLAGEPGTRPALLEEEILEKYLDLNPVQAVSDARAPELTQAAPEARRLQVRVFAEGRPVDGARLSLRHLDLDRELAGATARAGGLAEFHILPGTGALVLRGTWDSPEGRRYQGLAALDTSARDLPESLRLDLRPAAEIPAAPPPLRNDGVVAESGRPLGPRLRDAWVRDARWALLEDRVLEEEDEGSSRPGRRVRVRFLLSHHPWAAGAFLGHLLVWVDGEPVAEEELDTLLDEIAEELPEALGEELGRRQARRLVRNRVRDGLETADLGRLAGLVPPSLMPDPSDLEWVLSLDEDRVLDLLKELEALVLEPSAS